MPFDGTEYTPDDAVIKTIDKVGRLICTEDNWGQGGLGRDGVPVPKGRDLDSREHRYCPVTAVTNLFRCGSVSGPETTMALDCFRKASAELPGGFTSTPRYNNAPGRTFSEIQILIAKAREIRLDEVLERV